jgi:hypothetical protein
VAKFVVKHLPGYIYGIVEQASQIKVSFGGEIFTFV